jgi:M6 family metalloprotease-like protein
MRHPLERCVLVAVAALLLWPAVGRALEPPTAAQIRQYQRDGTLAARVRAANALGDEYASPYLVWRLDQRLAALSGRPGALRTPPPAWRGMPTTGTVRVLVLLISFKGYPPHTPRGAIYSKLFGAGTHVDYPYESLRDYYLRSSYNQLHIGGNVLGWYQWPYPRSTIHENSVSRERVIERALQYYDRRGFDFARFDNNHDGKIDYLAVVWTGPDEGWASFWWGYETRFDDQRFRLDGKRLGSYSWQWEANPYGGVFHALTMIHETGHALGLPDYYDYAPGTGPNGGVGGLDMMDGNLGDHNCFSKFLLGWITPTTITSGIQLRLLRAAGVFPDTLLVMPGAKAGNPFGEFFMVENRHPLGNDVKLARLGMDGLLVWHVDSTLDPSRRDYLYNNSFTRHKLLRLMEADGLETIETGDPNKWLLADAGDFYKPGATFGPATFPNSSSYAGTATGVTVTTITGGLPNGALHLEAGIPPVP